ncbi:MAG: dihydroorotate dehydrogenase [Longimicrobiales bacterium]
MAAALMNLAQTLFGARFQNPVMLASGTCGYGEEFDGFLDIDQLGGLVTKAVTVEAREGNAAPRVAEFDAGMLNSVGLANVGLAEARTKKLPWLASRLRHAQVLVNVAGKTVEEYAEIVKQLDDSTGFLGYELNVSCPNVKEGGAVFSAREDMLAEVVRAARRATRRPVIVKLAPNVADIGRMAEVAAAEGADGLSLINTFPGLLFDVRTRTAVLGAGTGGVSGPAVLPMGVHAVWQARRRVGIPIIGLGGIRTSDDALQYIFAGASLVQIGTASFADPRTALRVLSGLRSYGDALRISEFRELVGCGSVDGVPAGSVG